MRIHFFTIEVENSPDDLPAVFERLRESPLADREKEINNKPVFLETCDQGRNGSYELNFTQRRVQNGPGYSKRGEFTTDFFLEEDAGFGEQTAAIWSESGHLVVQYNHYGVRISTIREYLQSFLRPNPDGIFPALSLDPVVATDAYVRLRNSREQTRFKCAIDVNRLAMAADANDVPLQSLLQLGNETNAGKVTLTLTLGHGPRGRSLLGIREFVDRLRRNNLADRIEVNARNNVDGRIEVLDLLEQREMRQVPNTELNFTQGGRCDYESRIAALRREFNRWQQQR